jgi:hypothetical protein
LLRLADERCLEGGLGGNRAAASRDVELAPLGAVVGLEEHLDGAQVLLGHFVQLAEGRGVDLGFGAGDQAVVADAPTGLDLLSVQDADEARRRQAARKAGLDAEHHGIEGVSILGTGAGDEAEVMREAKTCRESAADAERAQLGVVLVLVAASRRGVDQYMDTTGTRLP